MRIIDYFNALCNQLKKNHYRRDEYLSGLRIAVAEKESNKIPDTKDGEAKSETDGEGDGDEEVEGDGDEEVEDDEYVSDSDSE